MRLQGSASALADGPSFQDELEASRVHRNCLGGANNVLTESFLSGFLTETCGPGWAGLAGLAGLGAGGWAGGGAGGLKC